LFRILGQEIKCSASQVEKFGLFLLVCNEIGGLGVEEQAGSIKTFANFLHSVSSKVASVDRFKFANNRAHFFFDWRFIWKTGKQMCEKVKSKSWVSWLTTLSRWGSELT
jgi:hypothetical protein